MQNGLSSWLIMFFDNLTFRSQNYSPL